jgi:hypothetical protein
VNGREGQPRLQRRKTISEKERGDLMKEISSAILGATVMSRPSGYVETHSGARFDFGAWHLTHIPRVPILGAEIPPAPRPLENGK